MLTSALSDKIIQIIMMDLLKPGILWSQWRYVWMGPGCYAVGDVCPLTMENVSLSTPQTQALSRLRSSPAPLQLTGADSAISVAVY